MANEQENEEKFMTSFKVEGDTNKLSTDIDALYSLIKQEKKIRLSIAAKRLNLKKVQVQEWADVLEDHRMIDIFYPVVGDPVLKVKMSRDEEKKWKELEEKLKKGEKHNPTPKSPIIFILLIGLSGVFVYMTDLRYIIFSKVLNFIYNTPQIMQMIDLLPFKDFVFVNVVHITFGRTLLLFGIWRLLFGRRSRGPGTRHEPAHVKHGPPRKPEHVPVHKPAPSHKPVHQKRGK